MWSSVNRDEYGAPNMLKVTLMGLPTLSSELTEDAELRYRDALVLALGGEAEAAAGSIDTRAIQPARRLLLPRTANPTTPRPASMSA